MKLRRTLALILALVMLVALAPTAAIAMEPETDVYFKAESTITVNAGEGIAIWNTNIYESAYIPLVGDEKENRYKVEVTVTSGTAYDIIYPTGVGKIGAYSFYTSNFQFSTWLDFIQKDESSIEGMLTWVYVRSGSVDISVNYWVKSDSPSEDTVIAYAADDSPLNYYKLTDEAATDFVYPENNSFNYLPLALLGTNGAQFRRTVNETENQYEVFTFTRDEIVSDFYKDRRRDDSIRIHHSYGALIGDDVYTGSTFQVPVNRNYNCLGPLKLISGSVICALPKIEERGETGQIEWEKTYTEYRPVYYQQETIGGTITVRKDYKLRHYIITVLGFDVWLEAHAEPSTVNLKDEECGVILEDNTELAYESRDTNGETQTVQTGDGLVVDTFVGKPDVPEDVRVSEAESDVYDTSSDTCTVCTNYGETYKISKYVDQEIELTAPVKKNRRFDHWRASEPVDFSDETSPATTVCIRTEADQVTIKAVYVLIESSIAISDCVGGTITPEVQTATVGETVSFTVAPDPGYAVTSFGAYSDGDLDVIQSESDPNVYTFNMPAKEVTLSASFEKVPHSVLTSAEHGTLTADTAIAVIGDAVTLTLAPQDASYYLGSLSVRCGNADVPLTEVNDTTFTFAMPDDDVTASVVFVKNYFVCFENWNGEDLQWSDLTSGQTPSYTGADPVREPDEMYTYTFAGWNKEIAPVSGDSHYIGYTATYTAELRKYNVSFIGADGSVLQSDELEYGATPSYTGATPTKATDDDFVYTFAGWDKEIAPVTGEATYTATFSTVPVLHVGENALDFGTYENKTCPFTPETSGYYRFYTTGDAIRPSCFFADGDGNAVDTVFFTYLPFRDMHFELVAWLDAGETYDMTISTYQYSGSIVLKVKSVDMYTVTCDTDTPHGRVCDPDEPTFMAYTGQIIGPYATPDPGYGLLELTVTDASGRRLMPEPDGSYIMPASNVTVSATFAEAHPITCSITEFSVAVGNNDAVFDDWTSGNLMQRAAAGAGVEYSFDWDAGYLIDEFTIMTASGEHVPFSYIYPYLNSLEVWFTMPDEPVTITLEVAPSSDLIFDPGEAGGTSYKATGKSGLEITLPDCPYDTMALGKVFAGWSVTVGDGAAVLKAPGEKVTMSAAARAVATYADAAYGDVNCDGGITSLDASLILQYAANFDEIAGTSSIDLPDALSDVNCDGVITSLDASLILQYVANYDESTGTSTVALGPQS